MFPGQEDINIFGVADKKEIPIEVLKKFRAYLEDQKFDISGNIPAFDQTNKEIECVLGYFDHAIEILENQGDAAEVISMIDCSVQ